MIPLFGKAFSGEIFPIFNILLITQNLFQKSEQSLKEAMEELTERSERSYADLKPFWQSYLSRSNSNLFKLSLKEDKEK